MPILRVNPELLADLVDGDSTSLIICLLDLAETDDFIDLKFFGTGQHALDCLHQLDRPNANVVPVGLHIALPPKLNNGRWEVKPIMDLVRLVAEELSNQTECYAYRISSGRFYTDNQELNIKNIRDIRVLYQASNSGTQDDAELSAYQEWIAKLLSELLYEAATNKR